VELSPPSEADNSSATLLSRILCDPKLYYLLYKNTPLVLILSRMNSFHIHPSYKGSLSFGFSYQNCTLLSSPLHLPHAQPIPFDLTTLSIFCNNSYHEAFRYAVLVFPQYAVTLSIVGPTRSLHALSLRFFPQGGHQLRTRTKHHAVQIRRVVVPCRLGDVTGVLRGVRGGAVGWGTALQAGRSRVVFPVDSLEVFSDVILPVALWSWGRLSL
jgi:hypothetical protein